MNQVWWTMTVAQLLIFNLPALNHWYSQKACLVRSWQCTSLQTQIGTTKIKAVQISYAIHSLKRKPHQAFQVSPFKSSFVQGKLRVRIQGSFSSMMWRWKQRWQHTQYNLPSNLVGHILHWLMKCTTDRFAFLWTVIHFDLSLLGRVVWSFHLASVINRGAGAPSWKRPWDFKVSPHLKMGRNSA